jgi:hypothetical protein
MTPHEHHTKIGILHDPRCPECGPAKRPRRRAAVRREAAGRTKRMRRRARPNNAVSGGAERRTLDGLVGGAE